MNKLTPEKAKQDARERKQRRNARDAGNNYERVCAEEMRKIGFEHVVTSRSESKSRDDEKIDLMNHNEARNGRLPYDIQCKTYNTHLRYHNILKEIVHTPGVIRVIFHKLTNNKGADNKTNKFVTLGYYAILHKKDFLYMVAQLKVFGQQHEDLVKENNRLRKEVETLTKRLQTPVKDPRNY